MKYAKLKGVEKHPRKLPKKKVLKSVIDRFLKTGSIKIEYPKKREKPVTKDKENIGCSWMGRGHDTFFSRSCGWLITFSLNM